MLRTNPATLPPTLCPPPSFPSNYDPPLPFLPSYLSGWKLDSLHATGSDGVLRSPLVRQSSQVNPGRGGALGSVAEYQLASASNASAGGTGGGTHGACGRGDDGDVLHHQPPPAESAAGEGPPPEDLDAGGNMARPYVGGLGSRESSLSLLARDGLSPTLRMQV